MVTPFNPHTDVRGALPPKLTHPRCRHVVKRAYRELLGKGHDPRKTTCFIDIDSSERFSGWKINIMPCLAAGHARSGGPWLSNRGRRTSTEELARLQGLHNNDLLWSKSGISEGSFRFMLGNTMSLCVVERVLGRLLLCAGLVKELPFDRWAAMCVEP